MPPPVNILVFNAGSSSYKCALYRIDEAPPEPAPRPLWSASVTWTSVAGDGETHAEVAVERAKGSERGGDTERVAAASPLEGLRKALDRLAGGPRSVLRSADGIDAVAHRIVHGGPQFQAPARIDEGVKQAIREYAKWAPAHNPQALQAIELAEQTLPGVDQFAFFDTAFHRTLPPAARIYPGPWQWAEQGLVRYGFHGINHAYCAERAAQMLRRPLNDLRLITCHLGNGCSLAAIRGGQSIDTTMGFTPLEGLMMGSRSGSIDPGLLLYLLRSRVLTPEALDAVLNQRAGLLGISGVSSDMREVLAARAAGDARAGLAFDMFIHRLRFHIGAMAAAIDRCDALIFSAGIGEHSAEVRAAACANLQWMGVQLDASRNQNPSPDADVSADGVPVRVLVIRAEEDWAMARECWRLAKV